jgi:hypothetical protein
LSSGGDVHAEIARNSLLLPIQFSFFFGHSWESGDIILILLTMKKLVDTRTCFGFRMIAGKSVLCPRIYPLISIAMGPVLGYIRHGGEYPLILLTPLDDFPRRRNPKRDLFRKEMAHVIS